MFWTSTFMLHAATLFQRSCRKSCSLGFGDQDVGTAQNPGVILCPMWST